MDMANTFFGFQTELPISGDGQRHGGDPADNIDLINDETFGDDTPEDESWEEGHEKLASALQCSQPGGSTEYEANQKAMEERICQMVVGEDEDAAILASRITSERIVIPGCHRVADLDELFSSESPSGLLNTEELITGHQNIWSLPNSLENQVAAQEVVGSMMQPLHGQQALADVLSRPAPLPTNLPKVLTLEEIEREMLSVSLAGCESQLPVGGATQLPIGTPPSAHFNLHHHPSQVVSEERDASVSRQLSPPLSMCYPHPLPYPTQHAPSPYPAQHAPSPIHPLPIPAQHAPSPTHPLPYPTQHAPSPPCLLLSPSKAMSPHNLSTHRESDGLAALMEGGGEPRPPPHHLYPGCSTPGLEAHSTPPPRGGPAGWGRGHSDAPLHMRATPCDPFYPGHHVMRPHGPPHGPPGPHDMRPPFTLNMHHRPMGAYPDQFYLRHRMGQHLLDRPPRYPHEGYGFRPAPMVRGYGPPPSMMPRQPHWRAQHPAPPRTEPLSNGVRDENAGLMTQREKDWIIHIQMLQLQTENPYLDDFYYTTWSLKKSLREGRRRDGVQGECEDEDPKLILPQLAHVETKAYQPVQFENSLGRITSSNVHCPRQTIDVHTAGVSEKESDKGHDVRRFKQILLNIEQSYDVLLRVADMEKEALALPEEARLRVWAERAMKLSEVYARLHCEDTENGDDTFIHFISIKKGLMLVSRLLPSLKQVEGEVLVSALLKSHSLISKKEWSKEVLPLLFKSLSRVIRLCNLQTLVQFSADVKLGQKVDDSTDAISHALQNAFASSVIWRLVDTAEIIYEKLSPLDLDTDDQIAWCHYLEEVVEAVGDLCEEGVAPCPPYTPCPQAHRHLTRLVSHSLAHTTLHSLQAILTNQS